MTGAVRILTLVFWLVFAVTAGWMGLSAWNYDLVAELFGEGGSRLVTTILLGVLVLTSGVLLLYYRRSAGDEDYWSGLELVYALALFVALFYGVYSFFGWLFYA